MRNAFISSKAAEVSDRISAGTQDRALALTIQRRLRAYRPVWELAHRADVLQALLKAAQGDDALWWRPARVALRALATWRGLEDPEAAGAWLWGEGQVLLRVAAGEAPDSELDREQREMMAIPLVQDACLALYRSRESDASSWMALPERALICLYGLVSHEPAELTWMVGVARARPATAAKVLVHNNDAKELFAAARPVAVVLPTAEALAFLHALGEAGARDVAADLSQELYQNLAKPAEKETPGQQAEAAVHHLNRGMAASTSEAQDLAAEELEQAWEYGRALVATLAHKLGEVHHGRVDSISALSAANLGLQIMPESAALRASAAAALNDLDRPKEALALLSAAPASQTTGDYQLSWQRARALGALGEADAAISAASWAADLFCTPEQRRDVAGLLSELGEKRGAAILMEEAIGGRPDNGAWWGELGDLYADQGLWEAAEGCYSQLVALAGRPELASSLLRLGSAQGAQGNSALALRTVTEAAHLEPKNPQVLQAWVDTAHSAGEWKATVHAGQATLALQADQVRVHVLVGRAYEELGEDDEAHYHFSRATVLPASAEDEGPADAWLALSRFHQRRGELSQAEAALSDGLRAVPKGAAMPIHSQLARFYEESGRITEAHAMLERLHQSGIRSCDLLTRLGRVLGQLGHHEMAIARLEEAIAEPDADGAAYHALALSLEGADRSDEAVAAARQAALLAPEDGDLLLHAGQLCLAQGDSRSAVDYLQEAASRQPDSATVWEWLGRASEQADNWQGALDAYWLSVRIDPANPHLQYRIGVACTRLGQNETAITALNEAATRLPDDPAVADALAEAFEAAGWWDNAAMTRQKGAQLVPTDLGRHMAWARAARHAGDFGFAEEALMRARLIEPSAGELLLEWGALQRARGDTAGAIQHLRNLVRDCSRPTLLWRAGEVLMELGQVEVGARAFGRAVDLDPSDANAQARLGDASAALGDHAQALAAYQAAAQLEPKEAGHKTAIGTIFWEMGEFAQAGEVWEGVLEVNPGDVELLERLAQVHTRLNDPAAALVMYERAAVQATLGDSNAGPLWREAGRAALELGELDKAQLCLSRAHQAAPGDPEVQSLVGALADRLGRLEDALEAYRQAVVLAAPESQRAYQLQLADALTRHEHDAEALGVWDDLVQDGDSDETVGMLEQMGKLHARAGHYGNAESTLRAALEQSPKDSGLRLQLAGVVVEQAEEADYQRRAGLEVEGDTVSLNEAVSHLEVAEGARAGRDLARGRLLLGGINEAILGLKRYLSSSGNPAANDLKAQRAMGVAYRQAGLLDASLDALSTAIKVSPTDTRTAVELAQTYLAADKTRSALTLLERLVEVNPGDPILLYHCALAKEAAGEMGSAIKTLRTAVELDSSVVEWNRVLAGWLRGEGEALAALSFAETAAKVGPTAGSKAELAKVLTELDRIGEAILQWREALSLSPDNAEGWAELGALYLADERSEQAVNCFERAIQLGGDKPEASHHIGRAQALISLGSMDEASRTIEAALDLDPQSPAVHASRGHWLAAQGHWQDALVSYQTAAMRAGNGAAAVPSEQASYLLNVARAYHALGSSEQALQVLERAATLSPRSGDLFALMGDVYRELGKKDLARQAYQQAAKVSLSKPSHVLRLAQFLQMEGQLDQALDWLVKGNAVKPSATLWVETGRIYKQRKQRGKQMESLHQAAVLDPNCAEAYYELGLAYKQRKEYQLAIDAFKNTVELEPGNQDAHKQLSAVLAMSLAGTLSGRKR